MGCWAKAPAENASAANSTDTIFVIFIFVSSTNGVKRADADTPVSPLSMTRGGNSVDAPRGLGYGARLGLRKDPE